ncbi:hypothetical protein ABVT39_025453 [Epinephelus coioides]
MGLLPLVVLTALYALLTLLVISGHQEGTVWGRQFKTNFSETKVRHSVMQGQDTCFKASIPSNGTQLTAYAGQGLLQTPRGVTLLTFLHERKPLTLIQYENMSTERRNSFKVNNMKPDLRCTAVSATLLCSNHHIIPADNAKAQTRLVDRKFPQVDRKFPIRELRWSLTVSLIAEIKAIFQCGVQCSDCVPSPLENNQIKKSLMLKRDSQRTHSQQQQASTLEKLLEGNFPKFDSTHAAVMVTGCASPDTMNPYEHNSAKAVLVIHRI